MAALQAPMASGIIGGAKKLGFFSAKQLSANAMFINGRISGFRRATNGGVRVWNRIRCHTGSFKRIRCRFSSSNDGGDKVTGNSDDSDADFVNSTVIEAVEVKNGSDGFMIKMRDGRYLRCVYNNPKGGYPPDYISHPAIVLKLEDGSGILLPILVMEMPSALLMAALRNVEMARPTVYKIVMDMIETMGYKVDDETDCHCFDIRPSDAINIAVRCKAPIEVNKSLAYNDGLKIVEPANSLLRPPLADGSLLSEMDRPDGQPCPESEEFILLRNMLIAAVEERYRDAAQWKDLLKQFRSRKQKWT
ncbi:hypothetical protein Cgig2_009593 [Carnegiea gigantea]|uniref:BFN domain-containing protein n=1 Tax=Carnegiea gigantea TaxID=171969 RepID=A0A9Q1QFD2_9CARY|nr:hypothetical protein Cgig2_009593 [Carnegiea gigantea]